MRNVSGKLFRDIQDTHLSPIQYNMLELDRPQMTAWRMPLHAGYFMLQTHTHNILCYQDALTIFYAINTHSQCLMFIHFPLQQG